MWYLIVVIYMYFWLAGWHVINGLAELMLMTNKLTVYINRANLLVMRTGDIIKK